MTSIRRLPLGFLLLCALLLSALAACTTPTPDSPEACRLELKADLPIHIVQQMPTVAVSIGGEKVTLILDTGAGNTLLTQAAARRVGARQFSGGLVSSAGSTGTLNTYAAQAGRLEAGGAVQERTILLITPEKLPLSDEGQAEGLLGTSFLQQFDADIDLGAGRLRLFRRRDCRTAVPDWTFPYETLPAVRDWPFTIQRPAVTVRIDGHDFPALLDTGATRSLLSTRGVLALGTQQKLADAQRIGVRGVAGVAGARLLRFGTLTIGDYVWTAPELVVLPRLDTSIDALIGAEYLRTHRLWISYATGRIYAASTAKATLIGAR